MGSKGSFPPLQFLSGVSPLSRRRKLKVTGAGQTFTDNGSELVLDIPGGGGSADLDLLTGEVWLNGKPGFALGTNVSAALQAAIQKCHAGPVGNHLHIPPGLMYAVGMNLNPLAIQYPHILISGAGNRATAIYQQGSNLGDAIFDLNMDQNYIGAASIFNFRDMTLGGAGIGIRTTATDALLGPPNGVGVTPPYTYWNSIRDLYMTGFDQALLIKSSMVSHYERIVMESVNNGLKCYGWAGSGHGPDASTFNDLRITGISGNKGVGPTNYALYLKDGFAWQINGGDCEIWDVAVYIGKAAYATAPPMPFNQDPWIYAPSKVDGMYFEQNNTDIWLAAGCPPSRILGCLLSASASQGSVRVEAGAGHLQIDGCNTIAPLSNTFTIMNLNTPDKVRVSNSHYSLAPGSNAITDMGGNY